MAISRADFWSFINELVTSNPTMGIPALEDGLVASLLIFNEFLIFLAFERRKGQKGQKGRKGLQALGGISPFS